MNNQELTYSEMVYLFADKFVSQRAKFVNIVNHPGGEKIPVKVLGDLMISSAVLFLERQGYIKLFVKDVKKLVFFNGKDIFADRLKNSSGEVTGIESILLQNISGETKLQKAVYNLLTADDVLPWNPVIEVSKQSLVEKGYINSSKEKKLLGYVTKYSMNKEKVGEAVFSMVEVQDILHEFSSRGDYEMIMGAVKKGISARIEHSSSDD